MPRPGAPQSQPNTDREVIRPSESPIANLAFIVMNRASTGRWHRMPGSGDCLKLDRTGGAVCEAESRPIQLWIPDLDAP
jgi:hypothetical protein